MYQGHMLAKIRFEFVLTKTSLDIHRVQQFILTLFIGKLLTKN